jgi:hypothetical protein
MPWGSVRAFSGAWLSPLVQVRAIRCRARRVTKAAALLGGWRLLALLAMRLHANALSKGYPTRTVRHTVASHGMQHIDLCDAENMFVNNMAPELLLR